MIGNNRRPIRQHRFIISGESSPDEIRRFKTYIKELGGILHDCTNEQFISSCTHVICFSFFASVKIMGGLATGKWLVEKKYIEDSYANKKWLSEENYEVGNCAGVAKYCRIKYKDIHIYEGLTLYLESQKNTKSFKRAFLAGGAEVFNKIDILINKKKVLLAFSDEASYNSVKRVVGIETPILKLEYLVKTLFMKYDPRKIAPFLIESNTNLDLESISRKIAIAQEERYLKIARNFNSPRNISRTSSGSKKKQGSLIPFLIKSEPTTNERKKPKLDIVDTDSEIEIIMEYNKLKISPQKTSSIKQERIDSHVEESKNTGTNSSLTNEMTECKPGHTNTYSDHSDMDVLSTNESNVNQTAPDQSGSLNQPSVKETLPLQEHNNSSLKRSKNEIYRENKRALQKAGCANINISEKYILDILSRYLIEINTSHYLLRSNTLLFPKCELYNNTNIIKSKNISELKAEATTLYTTLVEQQFEQMTVEKIGRSNVNVLKRTSHLSYDEGDIILVLNNLEWFQYRIQKDSYPASQVVALMIKVHIISCPVQVVRNRAINVFGNLLSLHPPHNKTLRDYYMNILYHSAPDEKVQSQNKAWEFIRTLIQDVLSDQGQSSETSFTLLTHILSVLEIDLFYCNERPIAIKKLICYRLFWFSLMENPSILNNTVKDLIQLWLMSHSANVLVKRILTRLFCILLDTLWKWSEATNPLIIADWPLDNKWNPTVNEIYLKFKGINDVSSLLSLMNFVEVPWQKMLLYSLIYRCVTLENKNYKISFDFLKEEIEGNAKMCSVEKIDHINLGQCEIGHATIMKILARLFSSLIETSGAIYFKTTVERRFKYATKNKKINDSIIMCDSENRTSDSQKMSSESDNRSTDSYNFTTDSQNQATVSQNCSIDSEFLTTNNATNDSQNASRIVSQTGKRKLPEMDCESAVLINNSPTGEEEGETGPNIATKEMIEQLTKVFKKLTVHVPELKECEKKCTHLSGLKFVKNL